MSHSVYERVIINGMLVAMDNEQLLAELKRATFKADTTYGGEYVVNMAHVSNIRNHLIRRGVQL